MNHSIRLGLAGLVIAGCAGEKIEIGPDDAGPTVSIDAGVVVGADGGHEGHPIGAGDADACPVGNGWLLFDSDRDAFKRGIFAVRADGTDLTRLTNGPAFEQHPALAPDGVRLAYASDAEGKSQIYIVDLATRAITKVTSRSEAADEPAWSPDGNLLAFHSGVSVFTIRPDGTEETEIVTGETGCICAYRHPAFTADSRGLVADRANQIELFDLQTKQRSFVVPNGAYRADMPSLSSDGHSLAYVGDCGVTVTPFQTPAYCTQSIAPNGSRPSFGPGNRLAYEEGTPDRFGVADIFVTTAGCSAPFNVTKHGADDRNARWAPPAFHGVDGVPPPK